MKVKNKVLALLVIYILYLALLLVVFYPRIKDSIEKSQIKVLLQELKEAEINENRKVKVNLYNETDAKEFYIYTPSYGASIYHDTIEALIAFDVEVEGNYTTLINEKTKLIGLTVEKEIAYVDFNKNFLKSKNNGPFTAMDQVISTLLLFDEIKKVVILINGKPLDSF